MSTRTAMAEIQAARKAAVAKGEAKKAAELKTWASAKRVEPKVDEEAKAKQLVIAAVRKTGAKHAGLAALPDLRSELSELGSRAHIDEILHRLEREGVIDMKVANDPRLIPDLSAAIQRHDPKSQDVRHVYYVTLR